MLICNLDWEVISSSRRAGNCEMEFISTSRGGRQLVKESFIFNKNKTVSNGNTYWECKERRSGNGCDVKILLDQHDNFVRQTGQHTHVPDPDKVNVERIRSSIKRDARATDSTTNNILAVNLVGAGGSTLAKLPRLETIRRDVRRQRVEHGAYPPIPDINDTLFNIPNPINVTINGALFLQYDNNRADRLLIFGTAEQLHFLEESDNWFMDGTFSTVPPQFSQLYTVHGLKEGRNVVGAYALLINKRRETYEELLTEIRALTNQVIPHSIMIDFEQAMITACEQIYPGVPIKGCLFHLSQNIYRRVQASGLAQAYVNDDIFRTNIRMISALSFVPVADTIQAFDQLCNYAGNQEQVVLDYFETNYVGEMRRGRRRPPRFPHAMWNVHLRVQNDVPRTNNDLEGWHNKFGTSFSHRHAHIWLFIDGLKKDSALNHHTMAHVDAGVPAPPQKAVYRDINVRIRRLVATYQNNNIIQFLRGISYNLVA